MNELSEMTDQEVVNLICELRPAAKTVPLEVEMEVTHVEWDRLRAAEQEIADRGYVESSRGYWEHEDGSKPYLIKRHG